MCYVAAYLLAALGGNESPAAGDLRKILESFGVGYDAERSQTVVDKCAEKSIQELIAEGSTKMASMSVDGGGKSAAASAGGDAAPAAVEKEKENKPESDEDSDDDMGFGLFD